MRVLQLHISDYHRGGGGGVGMYRIHLGLRKAGIDSRILCGIKTVKSPNITKIPRMPRLERLLGKITSKLGLNDIHLVGSFKAKQQEAYVNADILHVHGTHSRAFSYLALPSLAESKPAVFTLHDMWAFTGHCAYSRDCDRWKIGCGKCPYPDSYPPIRRDNTRLEWKLKEWVYSRSNLTFVSESNWITEQAKQSMISRFPIHQIPCGVDTETYQPLDPKECRSLLGVPPDKKVLMSGARNLKNYRKGGDLLLKALQSLPASLKAETVLLTIGTGGEGLSEAVGIPVINFGYVSSDRLKAIIYSAADLFLFPTRAETFGLVSIESQACGTPVVSFRVSGIPDHVRHGLTGYLAEPENAKDFCNGIVQLLEDKPLRNCMSQQCRAVVLKEYRLELQVQRHTQLYRKLLQNRVASTRDDAVSESSQTHTEKGA